MEFIKEKIRKIVLEIEELKKNSDFEKSSEWKILFPKITTEIWKLAQKIWKNEIENFSVEITETSKNCIKAYKSSEGDFINYLERSLKNAISKAKQKSKLGEIHQGMDIPEKKQKQIFSLIKIASEYGKKLNEEKTILWLSEQTEYSKDKISYLLQKNFQSKVSGEYVKSDDGEISIFDTIPKDYSNSENQDIYQKIKDYLSKIENVFENQQERIKDYLSSLLTRQILEEFYQIKELSKTGIDSLLQNRNFTSFQNAKSVIQSYQNGNMLNQIDIANMFQKDKSDASRTMIKFIKKLGEKVDKN